MPPLKEFTCRGLNYEVSLSTDSITVKGWSWGRPRSHELPIQRVRTIIVQRKSVIPFAAFTILSAMAALLAMFNLLWFLMNLSQIEELTLGSVALVGVLLFAIPTLLRMLFVDVIISWGGGDKYILLRLVRANQGRKLASRFERISSGG